MIQLSAFPDSRRLLLILTTVIAASSPLAYAQTAVPAPDAELPATIEAGRISGVAGSNVKVEQNVEITRGNTVITADQATYDVTKNRVDASGNVCLTRDSDRYTGNALQFWLDTKRGYIDQPTYLIGRNRAHGDASRIEFQNAQQATIDNGTYSTCEGPDPDWYLKADVMHLDTGTDVGTAADAILYFKHVPILGTPGISFPLSDARKSGLLPPQIGTSSNSGLEITLPYYLNLAPNYDLTLYPNLISRRGVQLGATGRYLTETYSGETSAELLPNDRLAGASRYAISSVHRQTLAPNLSMAWNLNAASDDNYPSDFPRTITTASQRLLLRDLDFAYGAAHWNVNARMSNYQVLQDPAAPIARPYDRLPQLNFHAGEQDVHGLDWSFDDELTRFWHPDLVRGDRLVVNPKIAYPLVYPSFFITPRLSFDYTRYNLSNVAPGAPDTLSRALPTFSLDSGLVFERDTRFFNEDATQTLEPRLFYVRTPYRDQSQFPNFDTAVADLSFAQLFSENRFVGHDRISEANQLTAALVTRYIEPNGLERLRAAIGQRFYFTDQRVQLDTETNSVSRSDILASLTGTLTPTLTTEANLQYNQSLHSLNRANLGIGWQPLPKHVLNVEYRRDLPNSLKQLDTSAEWPLTSRWYGVGRVNYSLPDHQVVEGLAGFEYKAACWVFRMIGQRTPTGAQKATTAFFFQLELNGLARLGSNPLQALRGSIPGYQLVNQP